MTKTINLIDFITGAHNISVKSKMYGYEDSDKSNEIFYEDAIGTWQLNDTIISTESTLLNIVGRIYGGEYSVTSGSQSQGRCEYISLSSGAGIFVTAEGKSPNVYFFYSENSWKYRDPYSPRGVSVTSPILKITGGNDVSNPKLLDWLKKNATRIDDIRGTWVLNDALSFPRSVASSVNFTSNGNEYNHFYVLQADASTKRWVVQYYGQTNHTVYDNKASPRWSDDAFKTITITSKLDEISNGDELFTWLSANAKKMEEKIPIISLSGRTWVANDTIEFTAGFPNGFTYDTASAGISYDIDFVCGGVSYTQLYHNSYKSSERKLRYYKSDGTYVSACYMPLLSSSLEWGSEQYKTITFPEGGNGHTNFAAILYLYRNGTFTPDIEELKDSKLVSFSFVGGSSNTSGASPRLIMWAYSNDTKEILGDNSIIDVPYLPDKGTILEIPFYKDVIYGGRVNNTALNGTTAPSINGQLLQGFENITLALNSPYRLSGGETLVFDRDNYNVNATDLRWAFGLKNDDD